MNKKENSFCSNHIRKAQIHDERETVCCLHLTRFLLTACGDPVEITIGGESSESSNSQSVSDSGSQSGESGQTQNSQDSSESQAPADNRTIEEKLEDAGGKHRYKGLDSNRRHLCGLSGDAVRRQQFLFGKKSG